MTKDDSVTTGGDAGAVEGARPAGAPPGETKPRSGKKDQGAAPPAEAGAARPEKEGGKAKGGKKREDAPDAPAADAKAAPEAAAGPKPKKDKSGKKAASAEPTASRKKVRGRPMRRRSKRHQANAKKVDRAKVYSIDEGVKLLKEVTRDTKFIQTVNLVLNLGIDPKHADQMIRGAVSLPKGIGKSKRVIAFCEGEDAEKAKAAGAVETGIDDLIKKVSDGWTDFDVAIAHPRSMGKVGKLGRVLGPQGKMPTPKNGTVTSDVETAVREFAAGKIEFRNDTGANIHVVVGKVSFSEADLKENILAFVDQIKRMKPATSKGTYIKSTFVSGTMSPAIAIQVG